MADKCIYSWTWSRLMQLNYSSHAQLNATRLLLSYGMINQDDAINFNLIKPHRYRPGTGSNAAAL